jgi:phosphate transport system protein
MRAEFHADLAIVRDLLVNMAEQVRAAMKRSTTALLEIDQTDAEEVVHADVDVDLGYQAVEERVYDLLARQAPVASDLRQLVTALHTAANLERMGDLAAHVAQVCLRRLPGPAVPDELVPVIKDMAEVCDTMAGKVADSLRTADAELARQLERDDDRVDELNRQLFALMLGAAWRHGVADTIDGAMLARWYERYADHAVNAGRHVVFLVTGEAPRRPAEADAAP